jgi:hypothetical protein
MTLTAKPDMGFGIAVTFSSGFFAWIRNVSPPGMERAALETTHAATPNGKKTFMPSDLADMGEATVELLFNPSLKPPIDGAAETVTITFPLPEGGATPATWAFEGFLTKAEQAVPYDDMMTQTCTLKVSGDITVVAAA